MKDSYIFLGIFERGYGLSITEEPVDFSMREPMGKPTPMPIWLASNNREEVLAALPKLPPGRDK